MDHGETAEETNLVDEISMVGGCTNGDHIEASWIHGNKYVR